MATKRKGHIKLKFKKKKPKIGESKQKTPTHVDPANARVDGVINTTAMDTDKLGDLGKFIKMDDEELYSHVPKDGKGVGGNLTEDETNSRLVMVHRMQLRGLTVQEMADKLGVSTRMVTKVKAQIREVHKRSFVNIDINEWLGGTMAFFDEVRDVSMLLSSNSSNDVKSRISALNCACSAEMNKHRFLDYCGVFSHIRQNQSLISEVIEHKQDKNVNEVAELMDSVAVSLFNV